MAYYEKWKRRCRMGMEADSFAGVSGRINTGTRKMGVHERGPIIDSQSILGLSKCNRIMDFMIAYFLQSRHNARSQKLLFLHVCLYNGLL